VSDWNLDPVLLAATLALLAGYLAAIGPLRQRLGPGEAVSRRKVILFASGWLVLALAVFSPLDTIGRRYLFLASALQLLLITSLAAPLLFAGLPEWLVGLLLPTRALREMTRGFLFAVVAIVVFNGALLSWQIGPLFEASLHNDGLHTLRLLTLLIAGIINWWPLLTPLDRHTRFASPFQILYLAAESVPLDFFGLVCIFVAAPFYPTYANAPRIFGISALTDQALAGGLLAIPNNVFDFILMSVIFFSWIERSDRAQRAREAAGELTDLADPESYSQAQAEDRSGREER
jgi:cytochrome c oxidase assembly factor CtaG